MLILTLKEDDKILIGDKVTVMAVEIRGNQIRLGIEAAAGILVLREKLGGERKGIKEHRRWIKTNPQELHQDTGQTLSDHALLPDVPTPCTMAPAAPVLVPGEEADRATDCVDHHGGAVTILGVIALGLPYPPPGISCK
jgi:carbon storage regulator